MRRIQGMGGGDTGNLGRNTENAWDGVEMW